MPPPDISVADVVGDVSLAGLDQVTREDVLIDSCFVGLGSYSIHGFSRCASPSNCFFRRGSYSRSEGNAFYRSIRETKITPDRLGYHGSHSIQFRLILFSDEPDSASTAIQE